MRYDCYCGIGIDLTSKQAKYILTDFELFCGTECLLSYIENCRKRKPDIKVYKPKISDVYECYDPISDQCYRSLYEVYFARFLIENGIEFAYEPHTFNFGKKFYTPDFYLPKKQLYVEIKGRWNAGSKKKVYALNDHAHIILLPAYFQNKLKVFRREDDYIA